MPRGKGNQTQSRIKAILFGTASVAVCNPAFDNLYALGFALQLTVK